MNQINEMPASYLPRIAREKGILPVMTVCECAVGPIQESIAPGFVGQCDRLLLIEPIPYFAKEAERVVHSKVLQVAVGMKPGRQAIIDRAECSYLRDTWSPPMPDSGRKFNTLEVNVVTFDTLDDGQIDILNLDCEGQEWSVLSKMISRPRLLNVELYPANPYAEEIRQWLKSNNYVEIWSSAYETRLYER